MSNGASVEQLLAREKIVAIIRGVHGEAADRTAEALHHGGIKLLEVTLNTENALNMIAGWRERYDGAMAIGAGTVLHLGMAKEAAAAGAQFFISPNLDEEVVAFALDQGIEVWPGVTTPTEIVRAWRSGAKAVKLFPADTLGLKYFQEVQAPLSQIPMIPTGGINLSNLKDYLRAGAVAAGIGSALIHKPLIEAGDFDAIRKLGAAFVQAVSEWRLEQRL